MAARPEPAQPAAVEGTRWIHDGVLRLKALPWAASTSLFLIWVLAPLVPEESGLRFGLGFRVFFTLAVLLGAAFFRLLDQGPIRAPASTPGVFASIALVYCATVGFIVVVASMSPQFELPRAADETTALEAAKRGEALFWKPELACFQCHAIAGRGGSRGPELSRVASRAGERVPGLPAERYLAEKVKAGATYEFKAPGYLPMMPAFGQTLTEEQIEDLVAYLLSLR